MRDETIARSYFCCADAAERILGVEFRRPQTESTVASKCVVVIRVLIIDNSVDAGVLKAIGSIDDLSVEHVTTGRDGLNEARRKQFDVIVLEPALPNSPGISVLPRLREEGSHVPVVIVTSRPTVEAALEAGRLGVTRYFRKPCPAEPLVRAIREAAQAVHDSNSAGAPTDLPAVWWLRGSPSSGRLFGLAYADDLRKIAALSDKLRGLPNQRMQNQLIVGATAARTLLGLHVIGGGIRRLSAAELRLGHACEGIQASLSAVPLQALGPDLLEALEELEFHFEELDSHWALRQRLGGVTARLSQHLREVTGVEFFLWRRLGRLRASVFEMTDRSTSLKEVAGRAHWSSQHQFNHVFRHTFGLPPGAFRRKYFEAIDGNSVAKSDVGEPEARFG